MEIDRATAISEMQLALNANIEYLREFGGSQIRIKNGELLGEEGNGWIYEFETDYLQHIEEETNIEVRIAHNSVQGRVIAVNDAERKVRLLVDESLGANLSDAYLIISSYYLLQLLLDRITDVSQGNRGLGELADKVINPDRSVVGMSADYRLATDYQSLNESQQAAVSQVLGSDLTYIWGPPGTGKTHTIAVIIESLIKQNLSVLLISHTNIATDEALFKAVELYKNKIADKADFEEGRLLREGKIYHPQLIKKYEDYVVPEKVVDRLSLPLRNEIDSIEKQITSLSKESQKVRTELDVLVKLEKIGSELSELEAKLQDLHQKTNGKKEDLKNALTDVKNAELRLSDYKLKGTLAKIFSLESEAGLKSSVELALQRYASVVKELEKLKVTEDQYSKAVDDTRSEYTQVTQIKPKGSTQEKESALIGFEQKISVLRNQVNEANKKLEALAVDLIKEAKLVATTLTKSYSSNTILSREYDCVIIDEASMAPLPAVWFAAGLASKKVIVIGDFLQLPPVVQHKSKRAGKSKEVWSKEEDSVGKWLRNDIFALTGISDKVAHGQDRPKYLCQLREQYRMHPNIAGLINELVYGRCGKQYELTSNQRATNTETSRGEQRLALKKLINKSPIGGFHIGFYDSSALCPVTSRTDSGSRYNFYQALICVKLAQTALESGYADVGIISAYRAQANLIQSLINDKKLSGVSADTVHKFQGGQKQVVIIDITVPDSPSMWDDQSEDGDDAKLMNVAVSRAQEKVIVVGELNKIQKFHSDSSLVLALVNYCIRNGFPVFNDDILQQESFKEDSEKLLLTSHNIRGLQKALGDSSLFSDKDFYKAFINDLLNAKKEVIIDSPFIATRRSEQLIPVFRHIIAAGVKVFVFTRVPKDQGTTSLFEQSSDQISKMQDIGIKVLQFKGKPHRKLGIIDRKILWEGSLNILSQNTSQELMRRLKGSDVAHQVMQFLRFDRNIGQMGEDRIEHCEFCKDNNAWYWTEKGVYGLWTHCLSGGHKKGKQPDPNKPTAKRRHVKSTKPIEWTVDGAPLCPKCKDEMQKKKGRFGEFWGCANYPRCRETVKVAKREL